MLPDVSAIALLGIPLTGQPVMLDGLCPDVEWRLAKRIDLGGGVTLMAQADSFTVTFCVVLPPESAGAMDLYVDGLIDPPVDLHLSAQVGERTMSGGAWPEWAGFGNHAGWYGPPVRFDVTGRTGLGETTVVFQPSATREIQLSTARFGEGPWRMMFQLHAVGPGRANEVVWPKGAQADNPETWGGVQIR